MWGIGLLCEESNIVGIMGSTGAQALRAQDCKREWLLCGNCWCGAIFIGSKGDGKLFAELSFVKNCFPMTCVSRGFAQSKFCASVLVVLPN